MGRYFLCNKVKINKQKKNLKKKVCFAILSETENKFFLGEQILNYSQYFFNQFSILPTT